MFSIIIFSKDRPLQLHAYLESILMFSDAKQEQISVIYKETPNIDYARTIKTFPNVKWHSENNFYEDLSEQIDEANDFIMFGCDDVVFTNNFSLSQSISILQSNNDVFGVSIRLGKNILTFPYSAANVDNYYIWPWANEKSHYGYPWELCCTLYRKSDIREMLKKYSKAIKSPNYFEEIFASNNQYIKKPFLACFEKSSAIVITVNRVQDTHPNAIDTSLKTDIYTLNEIYKNNKLDVKTIAKIPNNEIHVGAEYFILEKGVKLKNKSQKYSWSKFRKNIKTLFRFNIKDTLGRQLTEERLFQILEGFKYELNSSDVLRPNIMTAEETIYELINTNKSIARFGDGEFILIQGHSIGFQDTSPLLAARLKQILQSNDEKIMIGIPYAFFFYNENFHDFVKHFFKTWVATNRSNILKLLNLNIQYADTTCSQMYAQYENFDFDKYFELTKTIWKDKDITMVCGESTFNNVTNNIFDCAKSIEYLYCPSKNAFRAYEEILDKAKKIDKNRLIVIVLGPTATVLAFDLAQAGHRALDLGHIAKDYQTFIHNVQHNKETISAFFKD